MLVFAAFVALDALDALPVHHQNHTPTAVTVEMAVFVVDGLGLPSSLSSSSNCSAGEVAVGTEVEVFAGHCSIAVEEVGKRQVMRYSLCSEVGRGWVAADTVLLPELEVHTAEVDLDNLGQSIVEEQ
jgi:hypothetical protein